MAENKQITITGIEPAQIEENWFIIDKTGDFSVSENIIANIWLVGGGCDGGDGIWNGNEIYYERNDDGTIKKDENGGNIWYPKPDTWTGVSYSGRGGDGGYVSIAKEIKISKNKTLSSVIAEGNDRGGTSLNVNGTVYRCDDVGYIARNGGSGGSIDPPDAGEQYAGEDKVKLPTGGENGVELPFSYAVLKNVKEESTQQWNWVETTCNYVGSSGGGGAACDGTMNAENGIVGGIGAGDGTDHRHEGTSGFGYGCGGGGGAICGLTATNEGKNSDGGYDGGKGKQGCIIISYIIDPTQNTLVVQKHYKRICSTNKTCNTNYYSNSSRYTNCGCNNSNNCGCDKNKYTDTIHIGAVK
ncbi:MAG: hypothetical protein NC452_15210 [Eubacterium sp.]|nr:hypothetical protein [Eubacterium sp.]